jgi:hypothetical protein
MVYMLPTLLAAAILVLVFSYAVRSMLVDSAVANTESALHDRVQVELEALLKQREERFLSLAKRVQQNGKDNALRPMLYKQTTGGNGIVDAYYGSTDGDYVSGRGLKLESGKTEFRTTGW